MWMRVAWSSWSARSSEFEAYQQCRTAVHRPEYCGNDKKQFNHLNRTFFYSFKEIHAPEFVFLVWLVFEPEVQTLNRPGFSTEKGF